MYKLSKYLIDVDLENGEILLYSTKTGKLICLSEEIYKLIVNKKYNKINDKILYKLFYFQIIISEDENEQELIINDLLNLSSIKNKFLNLTIQPTANCQLGCNYCGQIHEKLNMSESLVTEVYNYIKYKLELGNYKNLNITWYGGEPLLGFSSIKILSEKLILLCSKINVDYSAMMITNGLGLKENIFSDLVHFNILKYQITLDGDKISHDNSRFTKKKGRTFDAILSNIVKAVANPIYDEKKCKIFIRCNVHKDNYKSIDNLIDHLYELGISKKISMNFAPVHDWGKNYAKENVGLAPEYFGELEIEWLLKMKEYGFRHSKSLLPEKKYSTCMVTNLDSELIDAKGRLSYCWEIPYTPEFDYENSEMFHGHILKREYKDRNNLPLGNWYESINQVEYKTTCKNCKFLPVCLGDCPINWYKGFASCPSFKYNIKDLMVLEYINNKEMLNGERYLSN
ncbi:radical SAM/SPASM domain-containing protein [Apibacter sp. B2912]|uniref:radical SAM/SPASM domain-containing protein n=1 Tax=Apibacter sp. B2912 TaxID=2656763 RepID=UPI00136D0515|nr:radical SAM protein [Apibacter sp. B2912]MXO33104.1 SPASM domain-containing protein [Apibacter sp. B2912]